MAATTSAPHFSAESLTFLRQLARNNRREWFTPRKPDFERLLKEPMYAVVESINEEMRTLAPHHVQPPQKCMMRIYRDTRFSADKTPYKTNVAMMFVPQGYRRMEAPGFGLQITPEQVDLVAGMFQFSKPQLEVYRQAVLDDKQAQALVQVVERLQAAGEYRIGGKELKRVPRGYEADHPHAEWLKYKGLHAFSPPVTLEVAHTPGLIDAALAHFRRMAPLQQWLMDVLQI